MAMIKCRECGKEISSMAETCPHCGAKTRFGVKQQEAKANGIGTYIMLALIAVGFVLVVMASVTLGGDYSFNFLPPYTRNQMTAIVQMIVGISLVAGGVAGIYAAYKNTK